jgi:hypothetical protein
MNLDERLEALRQTVELMAAMHRDDDKTHRENGKRLDERVDALRQTVENMAASESRLGERVDALTESVELMATMHRDNDKYHQETEEMRRENQELHRQNEKRMAALMDTMNRMGRILEAHDITDD